MSDDNFLSRWSRRKQQVRRGEDAPGESMPPAQPAPPPATSGGVDRPTAPPRAESAAARPAALPPAGSDADRATARRPDATPVEAPAPPTLDDVARLTRDSDYSRFVARGVDPGVRNAALKKLFSDPQFNVMDGLDVYIDDYGKAAPVPASVLRKMVQAQALGLFGRQVEGPPPGQGEHALPVAAADADNALAAPSSETNPDEDPDLRLQSLDAAGSADDGDHPQSPGENAGRER
jgi:hypothetical protein